MTNLTQINEAPKRFDPFTWISSILPLAAVLVSFGMIFMQVNSNTERIQRLEEVVSKVPVIESNVTIIRGDISEIKADIKSLLTQPNK
jgi:hypothetical protein